MAGARVVSRLWQCGTNGGQPVEQVHRHGQGARRGRRHVRLFRVSRLRRPLRGPSSRRQPLPFSPRTLWRGHGQARGGAEITNRVLNPYPLDDADRAELLRLARPGIYVSDHVGLRSRDYLVPLLRERLENSVHVEIIGALAATAAGPRARGQVAHGLDSGGAAPCLGGRRVGDADLGEPAVHPARDSQHSDVRADRLRELRDSLRTEVRRDRGEPHVHARDRSHGVLRRTAAASRSRRVRLSPTENPTTPSS